jgi:hypothetical protein
MSFTNTVKDQNLFAVLEDEADAFPFYQLPREFRDKSYEILLNYAEIHQFDTYQSIDATRENYIVGLSVYEARHSLICKPEGRCCNFCEQCAMLLTSKQMSGELLSTVRRRVPLHVEYEVLDQFGPFIPPDERSVLPADTAIFGTGSPATALMFI